MAFLNVGCLLGEVAAHGLSTVLIIISKHN